MEIVRFKKDWRRQLRSLHNEGIHDWYMSSAVRIMKCSLQWAGNAVSLRIKCVCRVF
jgi:hypothetical protein